MNLCISCGAEIAARSTTGHMCILVVQTHTEDLKPLLSCWIHQTGPRNYSSKVLICHCCSEYQEREEARGATRDAQPMDCVPPQSSCLQSTLEGAAQGPSLERHRGGLRMCDVQSNQCLHGHWSTLRVTEVLTHSKERAMAYNPLLPLAWAVQLRCLAGNRTELGHTASPCSLRSISQRTDYLGAEEWDKKGSWLCTIVSGSGC